MYAHGAGDVRGDAYGDACVYACASHHVQRLLRLASHGVVVGGEGVDLDGGG